MTLKIFFYKNLFGFLIFVIHLVNIAPLCSFFDLLTSQIKDKFLLIYKLNCFIYVFSYAILISFCFFYYGHQVLVVNNVCCLNCIIVFSSRAIIKNFPRSFCFALLYSICCLLNDFFYFESFFLFIIW